MRRLSGMLAAFPRLLPGFAAAVFFLAATQARSQSGLPAEGFQPAAGARDLFAARSPARAEAQFSAALGTSWAWRVLPAAGEESGWAVEQRLLLFGGMEVWAARSLRLGLYAAGAAWQRGALTDAWGEPAPLPAGMGECWLSVLALLLDEDSLNLAGELALRMPSASAEALAGEPSAGSRFAALAEARLGPVRLLLDAAILGRRPTVYHDIERAPAWLAALGVELAPKGWALTPAVEVFFERALSPRSGYRSGMIQVFGGGHLSLGAFRLSLGAAAGVLGAGAPALSLLFRAGWSGFKCRSHSE